MLYNKGSEYDFKLSETGWKGARIAIHLSIGHQAPL